MPYALCDMQNHYPLKVFCADNPVCSRFIRVRDMRLQNHMIPGWFAVLLFHNLRTPDLADLNLIPIYKPDANLYPDKSFQ